MIETLLDLKMPLAEHLRIHATRWGPPQAEEVLAVVSGIHGDEYDGLYVIHRLIEVFRALPTGGPAKGVVLIPAVNPIGLDVSTRFWPVEEIDINRRFPGSGHGTAIDRMAHAVLERARKCRFAVDIHASNVFLLEAPQVRLAQEFADRTLPWAGYLDPSIIWVSPSPTVIETTLSHNLNALGVPTFVIETGVGLRIRRVFAERVLRGICNFLVHLDALDALALAAVLPPLPKEPIYHATEEDVAYLNAEHAGLFVAEASVATLVARGDEIGRILDPLEGKIKEILRAPVDGFLFTLRAHPIVYPGSLVGRILRAGPDGEVAQWVTR